MPVEQITIEMEGPELGGDISLSDFVGELNALRISLQKTQDEVTRGERGVISYRVSVLSHASPYRVGIVIASLSPAHLNTPRKIARRYTHTLRVVRRNHRYARDVDPDILESLKGLSSQAHKGLRSVKVYRDREKPVVIDQTFQRNLAILTMTEHSERDEIAGKLDQLNIHNRLSQFHIYPSLGPRRILCKATKRLREKIVANAGRRVVVEGKAHYRKDARFPHEMTVLDIHSLPFDEELPRMADLHGIAPRATGDLSPEDFVRRFRDANW